MFMMSFKRMLQFQVHLKKSTQSMLYILIHGQPVNEGYEETRSWLKRPVILSCFLEMYLRQNLTPRQNQCIWIGIQTNAEQINHECLKAKQWPGGKEELILSRMLFSSDWDKVRMQRTRASSAWAFHCWTGSCLASVQMPARLSLEN